MDYKKAYKEALEKIQELINKANKQGHIIVLVEDIENSFPELKESEDDKISREITEFILTYRIDEPNDIECTNSWLAWLEKQGEHKQKQDGYKQGYKDAIDKARKFLDDKLPFYWALSDVSNTYKFINLFIKKMKER